jgi:hypothetical protein
LHRVAEAIAIAAGNGRGSDRTALASPLDKDDEKRPDTRAEV